MCSVVKRKFFEVDSKFKLDDVIAEICSNLNGKYTKNVIVQREDDNENISIAYFHIFNSINFKTVMDIIKLRHVHDVILTKDKMGLLLNVKIAKHNCKSKRNDDKLDIAGLMKIRQTCKFLESKNKNFTVDEYQKLTNILQTALVILLEDGGISKENNFGKKDPYLLVLMRVSKPLSWTTLSKIKKSSKFIERIAVHYDTLNRDLKIILKVES